MVSGSEPRSIGAGVRATRQRGAIIALLDTVEEFRSAQDLHDDLRRRGENMRLTTVYRTLQTLAAADLVDIVRTDTGESVYRRRTAPHHHHHLVCRAAVQRWRSAGVKWRSGPPRSPRRTGSPR